MLYKIYICLLICNGLIILGCNNHTESNSSIDSKVSKDTSSTQFLKHKEGEVLTYSAILMGTNGYSLQVETKYIYDSLFLFENWVFDLNEVVISQELFFKLNDSIIYKQFHDVKTRIVKKTNGNISLLDNVIREMGLVQGKKGSFYKISGAGGCNACSEYLGYYSLEGKLLSSIYSSRMGNFAYSSGNINKVIQQFNVPESIQKPGNLKVVSIFPPQYNGEIVNSSLK